MNRSLRPLCQRNDHAPAGNAGPDLFHRFRRIDIRKHGIGALGNLDHVLGELLHEQSRPAISRELHHLREMLSSPKDRIAPLAAMDRHDDGAVLDRVVGGNQPVDGHRPDQRHVAERNDGTADIA
jgi:hypothetical protein